MSLTFYIIISIIVTINNKNNVDANHKRFVSTQIREGRGEIERERER